MKGVKSEKSVLVLSCGFEILHFVQNDMGKLGLPRLLHGLAMTETGFGACAGMASAEKDIQY